jgi:hypothetical protein
VDGATDGRTNEHRVRPTERSSYRVTICEGWLSSFLFFSNFFVRSCVTPLDIQPRKLGIGIIIARKRFDVHLTRIRRVFDGRDQKIYLVPRWPQLDGPNRICIDYGTLDGGTRLARATSYD